jgi:hypothetical protein
MDSRRRRGTDHQLFREMSFGSTRLGAKQYETGPHYEYPVPSEELNMSNEPSESEKFDAGVRKILSVSHEELKRREERWKRDKAAKKRARTSPASRASKTKV